MSDAPVTVEERTPVDDVSPDTSAETTSPGVSAATIARYLFLGDRRAIEALASSPRSIWLAAAFVFTGALARNYDTEDLMHEPWHLLGSFGMSVVVASVLYWLTWLFAGSRFPKISALAGWRAFLTLFWMTAPMAWLYAVPYERFLSPVGAASANVWTLVVVSLWRVMLMARAGSVLLGTPPGFQAMLTIVVSAVIMFAAALHTPIPLLAAMGGVQLTDVEQFMSGVTLSTLVLCFWAAVLGTPITIALICRQWPSCSHANVSGRIQVRNSTWLLPVAAGSAFCFSLPWTQPEQRNRRLFEELFTDGEIDAAVQLYVRESPHFPPAWESPRFTWDGSRKRVDAMLPVLLQTIHEPRAAGLTHSFLDRHARELEFRGRWYWNNVSDAELEQWVDVLEQLPLEARRSAAVGLDEFIADSESRENLDEELRARIDRIVASLDGVTEVAQRGAVLTDPPPSPNVRLRLASAYETSFEAESPLPTTAAVHVAEEEPLDGIITARITRIVRHAAVIESGMRADDCPIGPASGYVHRHDSATSSRIAKSSAPAARSGGSTLGNDVTTPAPQRAP